MARLFIWYVTSFPGIFFFLAYMKGNPKQESVPIETQILRYILINAGLKECITNSAIVHNKDIHLTRLAWSSRGRAANPGIVFVKVTNLVMLFSMLVAKFETSIILLSRSIPV